MPLNYLHLQNQIQNMAAASASRQQELAERLGQCQQILQANSNNLEALQQKVKLYVSSNKNFRCAVPETEPLNAHFPAPQLPLEDVTILSADGSQITPNPHEAVYYGLVNIGLFIMRPGSGLTPETRTQTNLIYDGDEGENEMITEELINLRRDVSERQTLADSAQSLPAPLITLTDGPLELYHEPRQNPGFHTQFDLYINALEEMAHLQTITAGYIDRPRASLLINLLDLASSSQNVPIGSQFSGLTDRSLMRPLLAPGERSAIFKMQSSSSKEYHDDLELHFFYLNVGSVIHQAIARVEIPRWVSQKPNSVNLLHTVLLDQAHLAGQHPYPYALLRAHETAVVKMDESEVLKNMVRQALLDRGFDISDLSDSEKLAHKKFGSKKRFSR